MHLRRAVEADIAFICAQEARADYAPFVNAWPAERHRAAMNDANYRYQMFVDGSGAVQGFAITRGYAGPNRAIELMRMALAHADSGRGRAACLLLLRQAFVDDGMHRFWLDLFEDNMRAEHLYLKLGFVHEGVLRDAERRGEIFRSLKIMSMLDREYRQRYAS
jgi:RimJ/RimL family protein N-acetyltransferase